MKRRRRDLVGQLLLQRSRNKYHTQVVGKGERVAALALHVCQQRPLLNDISKFMRNEM